MNDDNIRYDTTSYTIQHDPSRHQHDHTIEINRSFIHALGGGKVGWMTSVGSTVHIYSIQ